MFVISSDFNDGDDIHTDFSPPLTNYFSTFFSQVASRLEQMYLEMNKFISRLTKVSDLELDEKLVVFTGRTGIVEVVDLNNPDNTCSNLQQFPRQFYSPISGVIGNTLVTCER